MAVVPPARSNKAALPVLSSLIQTEQSVDQHVEMVSADPERSVMMQTPSAEMAAQRIAWWRGDSSALAVECARGTRVGRFVEMAFEWIGPSQRH